MKWYEDNPLLMKIIAVVVAIGMFLFVSTENNRLGSTSQSPNHSITEVLTNIAVTSDVDEEQYYVSGIPDAVSLRIDGPQPIVAQTMITQNFNITTPNLNELGPGEHRINLIAEGLSNELEYNISPSETTVRVEERKTSDFEVDLEFDENEYIASGYDVTDIEASHETVTVSGAESTIDEIDEVKAIVQPNASNISSNITTVGNLVVLNSQGDPLNVSIDPTQIDVRIRVESQKVELPIELVGTGNEPSGYEYELSLRSGQPETIEVAGNYEAIQELDNFEVPIDLSGVTHSTTRTVPIVLPDEISESDLDEVEVRIDVTDTNEEDTEDSNNADDEE